MLPAGLYTRLDAEHARVKGQYKAGHPVEGAAADRDWTYRHVVVDEAQELSEMDWRVLMRRCPGRSFTVVGDLAQRRSVAGATSWDTMLEPYVPGRWIYRSLSVSYRTPAV